jgi:hypothetical protein
MTVPRFLTAGNLAATGMLDSPGVVFFKPPPWQNLHLLAATPYREGTCSIPSSPPAPNRLETISAAAYAPRAGSLNELDKRE